MRGRRIERSRIDLHPCHMTHWHYLVHEFTSTAHILCDADVVEVDRHLAVPGTHDLVPHRTQPTLEHADNRKPIRHLSCIASLPSLDIFGRNEPPVRCTPLGVAH